MATDPICGMSVDERAGELSLVRDNRQYYFCSASCLEQFAEPEARLKGLRRRLTVAWPAAVVVVVLTYAVPGEASRIAALGLASIVQFYPGLTFYRGAFDAFRSRLWNMDVLIAVGTSVAYAYSVAVLLLPTLLPPAIYFDASALIVTLILTGNYLEQLTRERASGALRQLQSLLPARVIRIEGGSEREVPLADVAVGDRLRVRPGDRVPVDGVVVEGRSSADESLLTGESLPVEKAPGAAVIAGSMNGDGLLDVEVARRGEETLLAEVGRLLLDSEMSQVPLKSTADRIAERFVPFVLVVAVAAALVWSVAGAGLTVALLVFVSVAITACPCAFGIATPAAILVATGRAAESGILFRGHDSIERMARVDVVLMDKTGTLTEGRAELTDVLPSVTGEDDRLLAAAAAIETGSSHPFARAVMQSVERRRLAVPPATDRRVEAGLGAFATVAGRAGAVVRWYPARVPVASVERWKPTVDRLIAAGRSVSVVQLDEEIVGLLGFSDPVRAGAREAVAELERSGYRVVIASGDHAGAVDSVADAVGVRERHAGLSPKEKLALLRSLQSEGHKVAYVGDGINDAPALAAADAGIAIGTGTDVAKETGRVLLLRPDLRGVPLALRAARLTVKKVRQNLEWAIGYNAVLLPVAAGILVPWFGLGLFGVLPMVGALAMGMSSTSVVLNSLSLRRALGR